MARSLHPFGERSFEEEKTKLGDEWTEYFFHYAPFVSRALDPSTYLIVGRRGTGKSSLGEFFKYQKLIGNARCIHLDDPGEYSEAISRIASKLQYAGETDIIRSIVKVWTYAIWSLIFREFIIDDKSLKKAAAAVGTNGSSSSFVSMLLKGVLTKYAASTGEELVDIVSGHIVESRFYEARTAVLALTKDYPVIVAIDSREQYSIDNDLVMWTTAGLVQSASDFNVEYASQGIHVKAFLTDEVYPHLVQNHILNTAKHIRKPLFLHWRPKDLVRLACWRFFKYLKQHTLTDLRENQIDWNNFSDVYQKLWLPHFGRYITNRNGIKEETLPYILRHTQMRPRQVVMICNRIAELAIEEEVFPAFSPEIIVRAVREVELELAVEVINSYGRIYRNVGNIISALNGLDMEFKGKQLDKVAKRSRSEWKDNLYSLNRFRRLVTELGIVGRKRGTRDERTGIVEADFEYAMEQSLVIHEEDDCVIHPMFYLKLNTRKIDNTCVYPFPDHTEYDLIRRR